MDLLNLVKTQWDRLAAIALSIAGAVMLISGWVGVSGTAVLSEQAPYIVSGGIGGIFCLGVGATLWISGDLRDEWRKLDRIEQALADGVLRYADDHEAAPAPVSHRTSSSNMVNGNDPGAAQALAHASSGREHA